MERFALFITLCVLTAQALPDRTSRIINGHSTTHQPFNAYVLYLNAQNAGFFGGGSLISDRHILTAAQNIYGYTRWDIGLGSNIFTQLATITSTQAIAHPNFNQQNRANDIGVITLPSSVVFTPYVSPISLPALNAPTQLPLENEEGLIVGFGFTSGSSTTRSDFLLRSFQRVTSNNRCQQFYQITVPNHFCGEDNIERSNVCNGDMGAAFVTSERGRLFAVGIASLITHSCDSQSPTGYTRIAPYRQWIQQVAFI
ncbi:collagenase-like [Toxorhynchites rutilus septentrionalis]|uniref:collagenase-like n=1 Tax=Toxorhynchites rutilus septentrionalis TaxID=329112 RepID=UPI00247A3072|nr:collagenase-like [Toxorhynchites rutilus septentrionalis]